MNYFLFSPKSSCGRSGMQGSPKCGSPRRLRAQECGQWWQRLGVVARVVGELDGDGLGGALGDGAIQLLDRSLSLDALIKTDEADTLRQTFKKISLSKLTTYFQMVGIFRIELLSLEMLSQPDLERMFSSCGIIITSRILCDNITGS